MEGFLMFLFFRCCLNNYLIKWPLWHFILLYICYIWRQFLSLFPLISLGSCVCFLFSLYFTGPITGLEFEFTWNYSFRRDWCKLEEKHTSNWSNISCHTKPDSFYISRYLLLLMFANKCVLFPNTFKYTRILSVWQTAVHCGQNFHFQRIELDVGIIISVD